MADIDLVRYLSNIAGEALLKAEKESPETAIAFLDEAEEVLALALSILSRSEQDIDDKWEAA